MGTPDFFSLVVNLPKIEPDLLEKEVNMLKSGRDLPKM